MNKIRKIKENDLYLIITEPFIGDLELWQAMLCVHDDDSTELMMEEEDRGEVLSIKQFFESRKEAVFVGNATWIKGGRNAFRNLYKEWNI
jgi:hypothetical protein